MTKVTHPVPDYYFFVLMRTDLASMNPGKAVAHGAHAASMFEMAMKEVKDHKIQAALTKWRESAGTFGTAITLAVNDRELHESVDNLTAAGYLAGVVHDPTYPITDGQTFHLIPLDTCGWAFVDKDDPVAKALRARLSLMA
jgi:peptidyl-tRNA hydrolase